MDNEKTKKEAYRPLKLYLIMCAVVVYYIVANYHGLMTHSFADNIIALISIALLIGAPIYTVVVTIRYILIISKKDVPTWKKVLWGIVLFEFNVWAFPIFWRLHIRIESSESEEGEAVVSSAGSQNGLYTDKGMTAKQATVAAFLPLILCLPIIIWFINNGVDGQPAIELMTNLLVIAAIIILPIYIFFTSVNFIIDVAKKKNMSTVKKVAWGIYIFIFNIIAFPIYWILHVDKTDLFLSEEEKKYRKEVAARNREFDKKRRAEIRENKEREKQNQQIEKREDAAERKQKAVSILSLRPSVLFAVIPAFLLILFLVLNEFQLAYMLDIPYSVYDFLEVVLKGMPIVIVLAVIISFVPFIFQVIHNEEFGTGKKIGWIVVLIVFNMLAFPSYWNMFLRKESEDAEAKKARDAFIWALVPGVSLILLVLAMILLLGVALDANLTWMVIELILVIVPIAYIFVALKYILLACENEWLTSGKKVLWSIGFILLGVVTCPVYWFKNIKLKN